MTRQSEASGVSSVCEKETVEVDRQDGEEDRSDWSRMLQKQIQKYGKRKEKVDKFGMNVIKVMDF